MTHNAPPSSSAPPPFSDPRLRWVERVTALLEDQFRIPGTNIRFGLDFLIGLAPWVGDVIGYGVAGLLVITMARHGASGMLVVKMIGNLFIDLVFGSIPVLGSVFDLVFRANRRNLRLLKEHYQEDKHQGSAWWAVGAILFVLIALAALSFYLAYRVFQWMTVGG